MTQLTRRIVDEVDWKQIQRNLKSSKVDAVTVSATHLRSGATRVFADTGGRPLPTWSRDSRVVVSGVQMAPKHVLASSSMPMMFPSVAIDGDYYCDGGVRQNTPLSPALRLGADKVLVIGVRQEAERPILDKLKGENVEEFEKSSYPSPLYLIGKLVDSIMLDRLDYDIKRLEGYNALFEHDLTKEGHFSSHLNRVSKMVRGVEYRPVDVVAVRPTRDIGEMVGEFVDVLRSKLGFCSGWIFEKLAGEQGLGASDLLSYLLFDGALATSLIELGRADAHANREALKHFLS